jgi:chaperonin GroES
VLISGARPGARASGDAIQKPEFRRRVMKIRPLYDRILVKRVEEKETRRGGIIIPDTAKEKPMEAEVVAVGKGKINEDGKQLPLDVKKGDRILIGKYAGTEIKIDEEEHLILREEEVLAVVEK